MLVHLCLIYGKGDKNLTPQVLMQGFSSIGGIAGHLEDPPEGLFVENISSKRGNYRILEGLWESGVFYLQRFVNLVDSFPIEDERYQSLANSIHALLKLSDVICQRSQLKRNTVRQGKNLKYLTNNLANKASSLRKRVQFSVDELKGLGIDIHELNPFILSEATFQEVDDQIVGHSILEQSPLVLDGNQLYFILPTATSAAIRRLLIEAFSSTTQRQIFINQLAYEYFKVFSHTPLIGSRKASLCSNQKFIYPPISGVGLEIDEGRYLNLIFIFDMLEDFDENGLVGIACSENSFNEQLTQKMKLSEKRISQQENFREGLTLIVSCGIGRGLSLEHPAHTSKWKREFISAPDLCTLSWLEDMSPLQLWRILQMKSWLHATGIELSNINGLLNLVAWAQSLEGDMVPHAGFPSEARESSFIMMIQQNGLLDLRHKVADHLDLHVERFIDGSWLQVGVLDYSLFEEDKLNPTYWLFDISESRLLGANIVKKRAWWFELASPTDSMNTTSPGRMEILQTWIRQAAEFLEESFGSALKNGPILWRCVFLQQLNDRQSVESISIPTKIESAINVTLYQQQRIIEFHIDEEFDKSLFNAVNIAERALVSHLISAVAELAQIVDYDHSGILDKIVPTSSARQAHAFVTQNIREIIPELSGKTPITINMFDTAAAKLGFGWEGRDRNLGNVIEGQEECRQFLNGLVRSTEDWLCKELQRFNREKMLIALLWNFEVANTSSSRWHKTSAAILALRKNKDAALRVMAQQEFECNAVLLASRILVEIAICECPFEGGIAPGELDLTILMAKALQLFHTGGWSDLIHWGFMKPRLIIHPVGDVHAEQDFIENVVADFGNATTDYRYLSSASKYDKNLELPIVIESSEGHMEEEFLQAWLEEFGASFDDFRLFIEAIEIKAVQLNTAIFMGSCDELAALVPNKEIGKRIISSLVFATRESWRKLPEGFDNRDIAPWKYRRRLSMIRNPLLQIKQENNSSIIVVPGLLRDSFGYIVRNYYHGDFPDRHLGVAMRKYAGHARKRDGEKFNQEVADRINNLGWQVQTEVTITKVLGISLDRNYGDVDVLAWDSESGRVLIMECKELQFRKTLGEIAEQMSDFRGELTPKGKPDLLKKHLDRVNILRQHLSNVQRYLKLSQINSIESHIVFRYPVPMQFSKGLINTHAQLHHLSILDRLKI